MIYYVNICIYDILYESYDFAMDEDPAMKPFFDANYRATGRHPMCMA